MRIKKIELYNFGSYEGQNELNFETTNPEQRVVVIGGKNGAGKTTLFTALQVCLYGHYAFGYKTAGKLYLKEIYNLINNKVRLDESQYAYLEIAFQQVDNTDLLEYVIKREWKWPKNEIKESVTVFCNNKKMEEDELFNFQNYLLHLIPPDLLKLYFFDGEKIADYFLSEREVNIRDALMILSGNDTFDILYDNVKRVLKLSESVQVSAAKEYLEAKRQVDALNEHCDSMEKEIEDYKNQIEIYQGLVDEHKKEYAENGGITLDEWKELQNELKAEEEKRERLNWNNKAAATDVLPFMMIPELVSRVSPQIIAEKEYQTYKTLKSTLDSQRFSETLRKAVQRTSSNNPKDDSKVIFDEIRTFLLDDQWEDFSVLFDLSGDEEADVQAVLGRVSSFSVDTFKKNKNRIDQSLKRNKEIKEKIQKSSIENFEEYIKGLSVYEEKIGILNGKINFVQEVLVQKEQECIVAEGKLQALKKAFEEQLKTQSVSAISGRVLLLLEELQKVLYANLIKQVESDLNTKFEELIRKDDFFTKIMIDHNFGVHILRNQEVAKSDLLSLLRGSNLSLAIGALGQAAVDCLKDQFNATTAAELRKQLNALDETKIILPVEVDKNRLSSGEKQIFVMALYWAMMNQSKNDLPFIIDTPFARTDTEHRANITNQFFKKLAGQLMILSTDEEISSIHMDAMKDQVSHMYMLEYGLDQCTHIHRDQYFEV